MGTVSKTFSILIILIIAFSGLIMVKSAFAQSIPKPTIPEFTLNLVSHPYYAAPITNVDPKTGKTVTAQRHVENKSIDATIKNQPFTPYNIISEHTHVELWYQIQFKGRNGTDWQLYSDSNTLTPIYFTYFTIHSNSDYTVISVPLNSDEAHVGSITNFPEGSQVDFQVRALIGQPFVDEQGGGYVPFFKGETGDWSNIQTITIPETSALPTPTPSEDQSNPTSLEGWLVENIGGGDYSESNGVFRLTTYGGANCPSIALYKEIKPANDFNFSVQVRANINESCALFVRSHLPIRESQLGGFSFEYGYFGTPVFQFVRTYVGWTIDNITYSEPLQWYTLQLSVYSSPFQVRVTVLDENGSLVGTKMYSAAEIPDCGFGDIRFIGFYVWGYSPSDYLFRIIENPFDNSSSRLSINTQSTSSSAGSAVNVFGKLTGYNNEPLQNKTVVLSYTFPGAEAWIPISSAQTNEQGDYSIQWINSASGTFTLKIVWSGDATNTYASNSTTLNFLPSEKSTFVIESNSTINQLMFDNKTSTLSFNVTGPSGTEGYVKAKIAKSQLANSADLQALLDGKPLNYTVASTDNSWIFTFNYSHSTHQINLQLLKGTSSVPNAGSDLLLIGLITLLSACLVLGIVGWHQSTKRQTDALK